MQIAPLIHTRLFQCDFNPRFAVRPEGFEDYISWARSKILSATSNVDILNGIRRVVASKGDVCIAGIACSLKFFAEHYLSDDERKDAEPFFYDIRNRQICLFLGIAYRDKLTGSIPNISYSSLWNMFRENIQPIWNNPVLETRVVPYTESLGKTVAESDLPKMRTAINCGIYATSETNDSILFDYYMAQAKVKELAFCSNVDRVQVIEDAVYQYLSTSDNIVRRIDEKKTISMDQSKENTNLKEQPPFSNINQSAISLHSEKSHSEKIFLGKIPWKRILILFAGILTIVVGILWLLKKD